MKTAVSIPDEIFQEAERLAGRTKRSRSELYSLALAEYLARHAPEQVTESANRVLGTVEETKFGFLNAAARQTLGRTEW